MYPRTSVVRPLGRAVSLGSGTWGSARGRYFCAQADAGGAPSPTTKLLCFRPDIKAAIARIGTMADGTLPKLRLTIKDDGWKRVVIDSIFASGRMPPEQSFAPSACTHVRHAHAFGGQLTPPCGVRRPARCRGPGRRPGRPTHPRFCARAGQPARSRCGRRRLQPHTRRGFDSCHGRRCPHKGGGASE